MEEIFAEFSFAIYELTRENEENTVFCPFFHMDKIYKNWTRLKLSKMNNKMVKRNVLGVKNCKNKFCTFCFYK